MKKIKKGISLIVLAITVIVMTILAGAIVTVGFSSFETVDINKFALEILNIQSLIDTYYYKNESYPVTNEIVFDLTPLSAESLEQFNNETITANKVTLKKIDFNIIEIKETEFGNNADELDVYALSEKTGKVYYLAGIEYEGTMNYTLTDNLYNLVDSSEITDNTIVSSEDTKVYDVIFKSSNANYTNQPVTVEVKLPKEAVINWTTVSNEKSITDATIQDEYKVINVNTTSTDKTGNYTIEINYTYNDIIKTAKYDVTNYDNVAPILTVTEQREGDVRRINITTSDEESGMKVIKYVETETSSQQFLKTYGKIVQNPQLVLDSDIHYTLYAEDNAGNYYILNPIVYAIYSETDNSFTFLRSGQNISVGDTYNGKVVTALYTDFLDDREYTAETAVPWYDYRTNITSVMVEDKIQPRGIAFWFYQFNNCSTLDVTKIDTSKVTSTKYTFGYSGTTVDTFKIIGLNDWDLSKVGNMGWTFTNAGINATEFDIGDLSKWNTQNSTSFYSMFSSAGKNAKIFDIGNIGNWNTSKVEHFKTMFYNAGNAAKTWYIGDLSNWDTSNVYNMDQMFLYAGTNATEFNIGDIGKWNISKASSLREFFCDTGRYSTKWYVGDLSNWDTSNVNNMESVFRNAGQNAKDWSVGDLSKWNTSNVYNMAQMFFDAGTNATEFNIGDIGKWNTSKVSSLREFFYNTGRYSTKWYVGDLSNWDTSNVNNMGSVFRNAGQNAKDWSVGDLSKWNTSKVTNMNYMFSYAGNNSTIFDVGNLGTKQVIKEDGTTYTAWDVSKVESMHFMFGYTGQNSEEFYIGDISNWQTGKVTTMNSMFCGTGRNADWSIDCSEWDVGLVTSYGNFNYYNDTKVTPPNFEPQN